MNVPSYLTPSDPDTYGVFEGDARDLCSDIEPGIVDLILSDPVYERTEDYHWLAMTAHRLLSSDSAVLAFASKQHTAKIRTLMDEYLDFVWSLDYIIKAKTTRLWAYNVFMWTTPVLWYAKGKGYPHKTIPDTYLASNGPAHGKHKWNKNLGVLKYWIEAFTEPGDVVLDPFCGGGSTLVAAKQTGRRWIGLDISHDAVVQSRERLATTQTQLLIEGSSGLQLSFLEE